MCTLNKITFNYWLVSLLIASMTATNFVCVTNMTTLQIEGQVQNMGHNNYGKSHVVVFKKQPKLTIGLKTFD